MPEVTTNPNEPTRPPDGERLRLGWRFRPPRFGCWYIPISRPWTLYWIGRPQELDRALTPEIENLMQVMRGFQAITRRQWPAIYYKPIRGPVARGDMIAEVCLLADFGHYDVDRHSGEIIWFELSEAPRIAPEISQQLLLATKRKSPPRPKARPHG